MQLHSITAIQSHPVNGCSVTKDYVWSSCCGEREREKERERENTPASHSSMSSLSQAIIINRAPACTLGNVNADLCAAQLAQLH